MCPYAPPCVAVYFRKPLYCFIINWLSNCFWNSSATDTTMSIPVELNAFTSETAAPLNTKLNTMEGTMAMIAKKIAPNNVIRLLIFCLFAGPQPRDIAAVLLNVARHFFGIELYLRVEKREEQNEDTYKHRINGFAYAQPFLPPNVETVGGA